MDLLLRDADKLALRFGALVQEYLVEGVLEAAAAGDVTATQVAALRYIERHVPAFVGELSFGLSITPPAATKTVDRLVGKGLVDRREDPEDRRQHLLTLTAAGQDLLDRVKSAQADRLGAVLGRMEEAERKALIRGLRGFMTAAFMTSNDLVGRTCERCGSECFESCVINQAHLAIYGQIIQPV
ncbi:MAG: MarR family transcriptional regulator [Candidatus Sericytochromatia bacterium]|nr:MarR family transcriptional regulator [Candidatus Tanganyikabacteria bacterium]